MNERVSVPSNLCVNESWSECDLQSVCENERLVSECALYSVCEKGRLVSEFTFHSVCEIWRCVNERERE